MKDYLALLNTIMFLLGTGSKNKCKKFKERNRKQIVRYVIDETLNKVCFEFICIWVIIEYDIRNLA